MKGWALQGPRPPAFRELTPEEAGTSAGSGEEEEEGEPCPSIPPSSGAVAHLTPGLGTRCPGRGRGRGELGVNSPGVFADFRKRSPEPISGGKHCGLFPVCVIKSHHCGCATEKMKSRSCFRVVKIWLVCGLQRLWRVCAPAVAAAEGLHGLHSGRGLHPAPFTSGHFSCSCSPGLGCHLLSNFMEVWKGSERRGTGCNQFPLSQSINLWGN